MFPPNMKISFYSRSKKTSFNQLRISSDSFTYARIWKQWFQTT